jgi:hypothetical protein
MPRQCLFIHYSCSNAQTLLTHPHFLQNMSKPCSLIHNSCTICPALTHSSTILVQYSQAYLTHPQFLHSMPRPCSLIHYPSSLFTLFPDKCSLIHKNIEVCLHSKSINMKLFQAVLMTTFYSSLFSKFIMSSYICSRESIY